MAGHTVPSAAAEILAFAVVSALALLEMGHRLHGPGITDVFGKILLGTWCYWASFQIIVCTGQLSTGR